MVLQLLFGMTYSSLSKYLQFSRRIFIKLLKYDPLAKISLPALQTKNTGNLPVHSQNVRVYGEVIGNFKSVQVGYRIFMHYLSRIFIYHTKFLHKKASECTGGIPVVHDWNFLNHESLHQRYFVGLSPVGSTRWGISMKHPPKNRCDGNNMGPLSQDKCKQNSHSFNRTLPNFSLTQLFNTNRTGWHQVFSLRYSIITRQHGSNEANCSQVYRW